MRNKLYKPCLEILEDRTVPTVSFAPSVEYPVGIYSIAVATSDFNGDGVLDLAVPTSDEWIRTVRLLLGNGDGTFQPQKVIDAGVQNPRWIAVADFDRDGNQDIALVSGDGKGPSNMSSGSMLLGNGDGTFKAPMLFDAGGNSAYLASADLNGDGNPDLLVPDINHDHVNILLGNGDGTFQAPAGITTGLSPFSLAIGDFNRDGKLDVAVANAKNDNRTPTIGIFLGNGDGTFGPQEGYETGWTPTSIACTDFNSDGSLDLVVAQYFVAQQSENGVPRYEANVAVLLGNGDGTFGPPATFAARSGGWCVAVGDLNNDGRQDIAVLNGFNDDSVSVLLGNGDGTFVPGLVFATGHDPQSLLVSDVNQDGQLDLIVVNRANTVSVLLNQTRTSSVLLNQTRTGPQQQHFFDLAELLGRQVRGMTGQGIGYLVVAQLSRLEDHASRILGSANPPRVAFAPRHTHPARVSRPRFRTTPVTPRRALHLLASRLMSGVPGLTEKVSPR